MTGVFSLYVLLLVHGWTGFVFPVPILSRLILYPPLSLFVSLHLPSDSVLSAALLIPRFSDVHGTLVVPLAYSTQVPCSSIVRNRLNCPCGALIHRDLFHCKELSGMYLRLW